MDKKYKKFLMLYHKKLQKWVAPGGHIELNEYPTEAALRETMEETGLNVELIGLQNEVESEFDTLLPFAIQKNEINEHHIHMDFVYLGLVENCLAVSINSKENIQMKWCTLEEIMEEEFESFEKTKKWCRYFNKMF